MVCKRNAAQRQYSNELSKQNVYYVDIGSSRDIMLLETLTIYIY